MTKVKSRIMSSRDYNKRYAKRGYNYLTYVRVYYESDCKIITEHKVSWFGRAVLVILYPILLLISILVYGLSIIKEFNYELIPTLMGKAVSKDAWYPRNKRYWEGMSRFIDLGILPEADKSRK